MAKKNKQVDMAPLERDDALFAALGKNKKRKRRKIIITVVSIVLLLAIVAMVGVTTLQKRVREEFAASASEVPGGSFCTRRCGNHGSAGEDQ